MKRAEDSWKPKARKGPEWYHGAAPRWPLGAVERGEPRRASDIRQIPQWRYENIHLPRALNQFERDSSSLSG